MIVKIEKYGAEFCQPCKILDKTMQTILEEYPEIQYVTYEAEEDEELFNHKCIKNIPRMFFYDENGKEVIDSIGAIPYSQIKGIIEENKKKGNTDAK